MITARERQAGTSLLEVLVSLVILAIGVLGMGALLTSSLRVNQGAYLRTQATYYTQDIAERMRSNRVGTNSGAYNDPTPALTSSCQTAAGCTAAQMAAHDVSEWETLVSTNLPQGAATVCIDSTPDDGTATSPACDGLGVRYAIKIFWDGDRDDAGVAESSMITSFQP